MFALTAKRVQHFRVSLLAPLRIPTPRAAIVCAAPVTRCFATKKKAGPAGGSVGDFSMDSLKTRMSSCVDRLKFSLAEDVPMGRANPALLDKVVVGKGVKLSEISQISAKDAKTLIVVLNDEDVRFKAPLQFMKAAEQGIRDAKMGLTPTRIDSHTLKASIPQMSAEHRQSLLKTVSEIAEKHRTAIRDMRAKARAEVKGLKIKSTDEVKKLEDKIQKEHDAMVKLIDALADSKKKEINNA
ncbi:hypothetical protein HDU83_001854 [Entophlyctis luteolus]|nr:hypothetical protein HDU83_001854 [Entophlyctis luteolus]